MATPSKRFCDLAATATEADVNGSNYLPLSTPTIDKKVPANLFALASKGIDKVRTLPKATEEDLVSSSSLLIDTEAGTKGLPADLLVKKSYMASIATSLYGEKIEMDVAASNTSSTYYSYDAAPMIGLNVKIDFTNQNTSNNTYFTFFFADENGTRIKSIEGNANAGQTKSISSIVPEGCATVNVRVSAYTKAHFELYVIDNIISNFDKNVIAEHRFNYNNLADVVVEPGETKQVRVNTMTYFPLCLKGKKITIKSIIDCPIATSPTNFGYWDSMVYDESLGQWTLKKSVTIDNYKVSDTRSNAFMYSSFTNDGESAITAKLNKVIYEFENTLDANEYRTYLSLPDEVKDKANYWIYEIHVGASYNESTEGWGVTKFASPYQAVNACKGHGSNQLEHCKVVIDEEGVYDISAEIAPPVDSTSTSMLGIVLDSYVPQTGVGKYFEMISADIQNPENFVIKFDGAYNYGEGESMTREQGMRVAIIHITCTSLAQIKGIKFVGKNGRYCIHPEFGRQSTGSDILFENCIFLWEGAERVANYNGNAVGMGLDAGDAIKFKKCKWVSAEDGGVNSNSFAHNNGYNNPTDFILSGAKLTYEECDMGNWTHNVSVDNSINQDTHDIVTINNCFNLGGFTIPEGCNWRLVNIATDI